ncbi:receptor protein kinase FERONIA [Trifolium repens]|nr:receptor protein kinase FERONIA [Trifolium repens]
MLLSLLFPTDSHFLRILASLNADVEGVDTLLKEYVINVGEDQRLDLSFIRSNGNSNNYAFINELKCYPCLMISITHHMKIMVFKLLF